MKSLLPLTRKQTALPALVQFLLLAMSELASSQPVQGDPKNPYTMTVVFVIGVISIIFLVYSALYFRFCRLLAVDANVDATVARSLNANVNATVADVDAYMFENFPDFFYSDVKKQKIGNGALECAICLNEFEDDETLRLLPKCNHVFHPHCIGAWLKGHLTCPVCRTNLADWQQTTKPVEPEVITETDIELQHPVIPEPAVESVARVQLPRSHTTGHSVVLPGECTERFTLRLPEDVKNKMMANWKMNRSNSFGSIDRRKLEKW